MFLKQHGSKLKLASFCSGTDAPRLVLDSLLSSLKVYLKEFGDLPDFSSEKMHAFSAEQVKDKRDFLKDCPHVIAAMWVGAVHILLEARLAVHTGVF